MMQEGSIKGALKQLRRYLPHASRHFTIAMPTSDQFSSTGSGRAVSLEVSPRSTNTMGKFMERDGFFVHGNHFEDWTYFCPDRKTRNDEAESKVTWRDNV